MDIEFVNRNLEKTEPDYFYRVSELVTTFKADPGKNEAFDHTEEFKGNDLLKCKTEAEKYYWERFEGLEDGRYFLPFAAPKDFEIGKNSAFSITLSLVEYYNEDYQYEHILIGEDEKTVSEGNEIEMLVLKEKGYL